MFSMYNELYNIDNPKYSRNNYRPYHKYHYHKNISHRTITKRHLSFRIF